MNNFERPKFKLETSEVKNNYGKFEISPLERGFGTTLGNALRRVMLSSLPGAAVFSVKIDGAYHEFTSLKGVKQDVCQLILNIKQLILDINPDSKDTYTLRINAKGQGSVYAKDIICPAGVEILNPELEIATLETDGTLDIELLANVGRGYVSNEENKELHQTNSQGVGAIYTDSLYSPVINANFNVETTRVGQSSKFDKLTIEVETDGSLTPEKALSYASKILMSHFELVSTIDEQVSKMNSLMNDTVTDFQTQKISKTIEDLDLTVRSYNCLKRANISTVDDLLRKSEYEMARVKNLGKKSLKEIKEKIHDMGLTFRQD